MGHCGLFSAQIFVVKFVLWFSYLIASMGLQVLWSFGLACLDVYALRRKRDLHNPILVSLFVVGDWVFYFSLIHYFFFLVGTSLKTVMEH